MERTRAQLRLVCDEEEDGDRRISPRKRKRVRYTEGEDVEEEENQDEEDDEQPGPSTTHKQNTQENRFWTVTCGNKTGSLDLAKLERAEECIKCEGCWFAPSAFEDFGGKGSSKKWKASIFYENKSLQFWFEQGHLTTEGFKRRRTGNKEETILSSDCMSESSPEASETRSAGETEEDDVKDEDWLPGSEELILETEEESPGTANRGGVVDSGLDTSKEEEDKMEEGEMEDEDVPAAADNDNSAFTEREAMIFTTPEKSVLQKEVKVVLKKLAEEKSDCQSSHVEHPKGDGWCQPLDEDALSQEAKAQDSDSSWIASQLIIEDVQQEITAKTDNSPTPPSAPASLAPDIKPETEDIRSLNSLAADLTSSPELLVTDTCFVGDMIDDVGEREETGHCGEKKKDRKRGEMGPEMQISCIKGFEDCENTTKENLDMSRSEARGQTFRTGNTSDAPSKTAPTQRSAKEERTEAMYSGPAKKSCEMSVLVESDATTSHHDAVQLQEMSQGAKAPQTTQASDITQSSHTVQAPSSRPSSSCDLDTMDLDQLRREKIKMQIKVLKLQEEYYTQKIKKLKK